MGKYRVNMSFKYFKSQIASHIGGQLRSMSNINVLINFYYYLSKLYHQSDSKRNTKKK